MKYRHAFHAGNFADVHKHLALVLLMRAMQRKERGFLFVDTHAGRGRYALRTGDAAATAESADGIERLMSGASGAAGAAGAAGEAAATSAPGATGAVAEYLGEIARWRADHGAHDYPGSPLIAARLLRPQDRGFAYEVQPAEFEALRSAARADAAHHGSAALRVAHGDGFDLLRAHLPPAERRGLLLIDPPYEDTRAEFARLGEALTDTLQRFETAVVLCWYPVKDARESDRRIADIARGLTRPVLAAELWKHPPDSRAALNGSGLLIVNAPFRAAETLREAQVELAALLGIHEPGRTHVRVLRGSR